MLKPRIPVSVYHWDIVSDRIVFNFQGSPGKATLFLCAVVYRILAPLVGKGYGLRASALILGVNHLP